MIGTTLMKELNTIFMLFYAILRRLISEVYFGLYKTPMTELSQEVSQWVLVFRYFNQKYS